MEIRELKSTGFVERGGCHYTVRGSYLWYQELPAQSNREAAYNAAVAWAKEYEARDRYGNMATAHGVITVEGGGWAGVVNYFHSNT